jgi:hypothetical protein
MAGDWIKMRSNLWDDPRVSCLCDLTDQSEATIVGGLYWLWAAADQHSEDGAMPGLTLRQIDRKTGIQGFGSALCEIGWIRQDEQGIVIARFEEHNGASAKRRCMDAQRKANFRNVSASDADIPQKNDGQNAPDCGARERDREREDKTSNNPNGLFVASDADDANHVAAKHIKPDKPDCPHQQIIDLYHEVLPMCPQVRDWTPARATALRARWNEDEKRQNLQFWRRLFEYVRTCPFLVGQVSGRGNKPFFAALPWICKPENFAKIREGRYENRTDS